MKKKQKKKTKQVTLQLPKNTDKAKNQRSTVTVQNQNPQKSLQVMRAQMTKKCLKNTHLDIKNHMVKKLKK